MKKTAYVVMSTFYSPVAVAIPTPKVVCFDRKEAQKLCDDHNKNNRTTTDWYVRKVQIHGAGHG